MRFFRTSHLFQDLEPGVLRALMEHMALEAYPKGSLVCHPDGPQTDRLRIIKKGALKVSMPLGRNDDPLVDYRGEGEILDFIPLLTGSTPREEAIALEDTLCYLIGRPAILDLLKTQPAFAQQFFSDFFQKYVSKPHREVRKKRLLYGGGERLLFTTPIGELAKRELITAHEEISIKEAAALMSRHRIGSLVLLNSMGLPSGIVTNKDFRDRVVSRGRDVAQPVKKIQSVSLVKAEAGEHCIEALFKMIHYNIRHLLVVDGGRIKGIVTAQDLIRLQGTSPISLIQELESQPSTDGLVDPSRRIQAMVGIFLQEGVKAAHIFSILTEVYDRLLRQVMDLVEKRLGPPPVPYGFLSLGCAGRKEQAFMTPQQNAVVYADPPSPEAEEQSRAYFSQLSTLTTETLQSIGFPATAEDGLLASPCPCHPLRSWRQTFFGWIRQADRKAVGASVPFFDLRCRRGDSTLLENLRDAVFERLRRKEIFLNMMAVNIVKNSPPLSPFRNFVLEKNGEHRGRFDLEQKGIKPLVDIVRLYALKEGVGETSTNERLQALKMESSLVGEHVQELEYAFEIMSGLWIKAQYDQWQQGLRPCAYIDPNRLNKLEKRALKDIFSLIIRMQVAILEKHEPIKI